MNTDHPDQNHSAAHEAHEDFRAAEAEQLGRQWFSQIPVRKPGFWESMVPVFVLMALLMFSVIIFDDNAAISATDGPSQIALLTAGFIAAMLALLQGSRWTDLEAAVIQSIGYVTQTFLILILVGALIGTWILGGIVPTLVVWGLKILSPDIFLPASTVICAVVALATGSSW